MIRTVEHVQEREGEYYVARTRVPIGVIIAAWQRHASPEQIVEQIPSLTLADIYGVVTYYLDHQQELDAHFAALREEYERERMQARANDPAFYADLAQRRDAWRETNPEPAGTQPNSPQDSDA
jgi:uncharacterized protein (DUF433 family)